MVSAVPEPRGLASPAQAVARWLSRRAAPGEAFVCGVRVREGTLAGEHTFWRFRRSVAEPGRTDGVCVLRHGGETVLKLRFESGEVAPRWLGGYVRLHAEDVGSAARVELICRADAARRLRTNSG